MKIPEAVMVTGHEIDLTDLTGAQKNYFDSLAKHVTDLYFKSGNNRYVIGISGYSGSGKSVLASILTELLSNQREFACQMVDLDAFHYSNAVLEEKGLSEVKGRYDTYDLDKLSQLLDLFKRDKEVVFPWYSREHHEPQVNGPIAYRGNCLIFLPGLWILRDDPKWNKARGYIDYTISIEGNPEKFKRNTINRHIRGGRSETDAEEFYNNSDSENTAEILNNSVSADLKLPYFEDIKNEELVFA